MIGLDIETHDPNLLDKGPGVYRRDGRILGVSIHENGKSEYHPISHKDTSSETRNRSLKIVRELIEDSKEPIIGANIQYDLDWLCNWAGFKLSDREIHDVQLAEPLIDEYRFTYSLDSLAQKYLNEKKEKTELEDYCFYNNLKGDPRKYLHEMPEKIVKKYAEIDAELPVRIFEKQMEILEKEELLGVYKLERELIPLLLQMRKTGVRIDTGRVKSGIEHLEDEIKKESKEINQKYGSVNVKSNQHLAEVFDELKLDYPKTEKGNPNFDKDFLKTVNHPFAKSVLKIRELRTIKDTFFVNSFTDMEVNGRIHALFNQLRSDEYGTVSGRFSGSNPNLQQIPSKGEMKDFCRSIFIPEDGQLWGKIDYSQIEFRFIAHYASGPGADIVRQQYTDDPTTDFHAFVMNLTGLERKYAKNINFGLSFFMGIEKMAKTMGCSVSHAKELVDQYFKALPFLKHTREAVVDTAKKRGYIRTIAGRRARLSADMRKHRKEYKIFNRLPQGSAADLIKTAMVESYKAGVWNVLSPHLTVHDELDFSIPQTKEGREAVVELKNIMETCIKLKVPVKAELEIGDNWANVSEERAKEFVSLK